jgi:hypothetical protein
MSYPEGFAYLEAALEMAANDCATSGAPGNQDRVTVFDPTTGKTLAGRSAPYRKNLEVFLCRRPGFIVKPVSMLSPRNRARRGAAAAAAVSSPSRDAAGIEAILSSTMSMQHLDGRILSGGAAPQVKNAAAWVVRHPGWRPYLAGRRL